jgi:hypothetical protein
VFEDSFHQLRSRTPEELRHKLNVQFTGEEGVDAGGVSREWYQVGVSVGSPPLTNIEISWQRPHLEFPTLGITPSRGAIAPLEIS